MGTCDGLYRRLGNMKKHVIFNCGNPKWSQQAKVPEARQVIISPACDYGGTGTLISKVLPPGTE
jgi:hypothetical protein